jgi:hypothetical protein
MRSVATTAFKLVEWRPGDVHNEGANEKAKDKLKKTAKLSPERVNRTGVNPRGINLMVSTHKFIGV